MKQFDRLKNYKIEDIAYISCLSKLVEKTRAAVLEEAKNALDMLKVLGIESLWVSLSLLMKNECNLR